MPAISAAGWVLLVIAALIIGVSKTGFTGVGILAIPLMAMVIDPRKSTGLILPMLIVGDMMGVAFYRRHAVWRHLIRMMPFAVAGILIGYGLLKMGDLKHNKPLIDSEMLKRFIGGVVLVLLTLNWWRNRQMAKRGEIHVPEGWWFAMVMGLLAGTVTMMANAAGPIIVIYLLAMRLPKQEFLGTGAWYFLLLNTFKVPFSWDLGFITGGSLTLNLVMLPIIVAGGFAGVRMIKVVPEKVFTRIAQILAAVGALQLLVGDVVKNWLSG